MVEREDWPNMNLVVESRAVKIDREISKNEVVEELIHDVLEARRFISMTFLNREDGNHARRNRSTTGKPEIGRNLNFEHQNGSRKIFGIDRGSEICRKDRNQTNGPRSTRWLGVSIQNVVSTVQQAECLQNLKVSPCMEGVHAA
ncbi:hypothetical protein F2Q69_00007750 [Brassica cretica]|uniref:Uncharacterized protein n=1 Tax=Brassica cretica TaxID=69181 RepID=A0A8S9PG22_BRACR|nr:hypothetical protein F2Q69_00007750 [Brassica cretica]